ncbi:hypothetical protein, partial [Akkermansia sp.]|uniref:hypothetical protein n=1 Tax=Akkermansia sp. TaxID=1872421 RepID=UPI003AB7FD00
AERKRRGISLPEVVFSWDGIFLKNNDLYVWSYAKMKAGKCPVVAIFLSSLYTLLLMVSTSIFVYILCKINRHWNPDEIYLVIAIRANMSLRRLKQVQFFLLGMSCSGLIYSTIYLILNGII